MQKEPVVVIQLVSWVCAGGRAPGLATAQPLLSPLVVNDRVAEVTATLTYTAASHPTGNQHEPPPNAPSPRHCRPCHILHHPHPDPTSSKLP